MFFFKKKCIDMNRDIYLGLKEGMRMKLSTCSFVMIQVNFFHHGVEAPELDDI